MSLFVPLAVMVALGGVNLPQSTSTAKVKWAINVSLDAVELKVEGNLLVKLEKGRIPSGQLDGDRILRLYELLRTFNKIEAEEKVNPTGRDNVVALWVDSSVIFENLHTVMMTAALAGYPRFRLIVRKKPFNPDQPYSVIYVSFPVAYGGDPSRLPPAMVYDRDGTLVNVRDALTVHIQPGGFQVVAPDGKLRRRMRRTKKGYDFEALARLARSLNRKHPESNQLVLVPGAGVEYQDIVHTLDAAREGSFDVVVIANAVEQEGSNP